MFMAKFECILNMLLFSCFICNVCISIVYVYCCNTVNVALLVWTKEAFNLSISFYLVK